MFKSLASMNQAIVKCRLCPRLVRWREKVAREKRASFADWTYWGKPLPGYGDSKARVLIVGLAPAAHGGNRTGRMFTGDRSGDWLYRTLYKVGFSNKRNSIARDDGLRLKNAYITAMVRCAPPENKPIPKERDSCKPYLISELNFLKNVRVIVALGSYAWDGILRILSEQGFQVKPKPRFAHGAEVKVGPYTLLGSYHPSQQNTFTGKLTRPMLDSVFKRARKLAKIGYG